MWQVYTRTDVFWVNLVEWEPQLKSPSFPSLPRLRLHPGIGNSHPNTSPLMIHNCLFRATKKLNPTWKHSHTIDQVKQGLFKKRQWWCKSQVDDFFLQKFPSFNMQNISSNAPCPMLVDRTLYQLLSRKSGSHLCKRPWNLLNLHQAEEVPDILSRPLARKRSMIRSNWLLAEEMQMIKDLPSREV